MTHVWYGFPVVTARHITLKVYKVNGLVETSFNGLSNSLNKIPSRPYLHRFKPSLRFVFNAVISFRILEKQCRVTSWHNFGVLVDDS